MKRFKSILSHFIAFLLLFFSSSQSVFASNEIPTQLANHVDSMIHLGLLTCQPSQEVYSLYGHTAIHYINREQGIDVAVNYGMFSFNKPHFILRFVFGLTDYEMGVQPFDDFCAAYAYEQRGITEQVLNIPAEVKLEIAEALERNYLPQNREYRYNYFYDNCTTRARDMIVGSLKPLIHYERKDGGPSFRKMIHAYNEDHPWARFGNDILLGVKADRPTSISEQQFLPDHLKNDFASAFVKTKDSQWKLVKETKTIIPAFNQTVEEEFPLRPRTCAIILLIITILTTLLEYFLNKKFWGYDCAIMLTSGIAGCILFVMIFSQHPTVSLNLQLLALNPLPLFFVWRAVKRIRNRQSDGWWKLWCILLLLFFIGALLQSYAEGMMIVACSLLLRCCSHLQKPRTK